MQNSQRARATRIDFWFLESNLCVISDNGGGLEGIAGLHTLLSVCDSAYDDPLVSLHQSPMGMGLYALFALNGVEVVEIRSNGIAFTLEVARWFDDEAYRKRWFERVIEQDTGTQGLELRIQADTSLVDAFRELLLEEKNSAFNNEILSPARGYTGILEVFVNGMPQDTVLPDKISFASCADIETMYEGNCLRIVRHRYLYGRSGTLYCNWYGQVIAEPVALPWNAYLEVKMGNPVNPQAPTRRQLIADQALAALKGWIETRLFSSICTLAAPTVDQVTFLYRLNQKRALQECPFALVRRWLPLPSSGIEDAESVSSDARAEKQVVRKSDQLLLLESEVAVLLPGSHPLQPRNVQQDPELADTYLSIRYTYGLESFISATGLEAYLPVEGVEATSVLWWRPGKNTDSYHTTELGIYGIGEGEQEPMVWHPLPAGNVYVCDIPTSWELSEVEMLIGVQQTSDLVPFLQRYGYVFFIADGEYPQRSWELYSEQIADLARSYLEDVIDSTTQLGVLADEIGRLFEKQGVPLTSLEFLYDKQEHLLPTIRVHRKDGSSKTLTLYSHFCE